MNPEATPFQRELNQFEERVLRAIRELSYGVVEVVVHERKITEIRQTRRIREVREDNLPTG